jgi:D-alanyl-D-alanine carboxypeptidase (penicillin-binding protein 5/6)
MTVRRLERSGVISFDDTVEVTGEASSTIGTSADLKRGDSLTVLDLLYGLMLPSGNDAAMALARYCGNKVGVFGV